MSRTFFANELEGVATFWQIWRTDGVAIGLTNHDRDLHFDGILHRAGPGMVPSAIRLTSDLSPDSAEVAGALCSAGLCEDDLAAARFDGARVAIGLVDWETLEARVLYRGTFGEVIAGDGGYQVELQSAKALLAIDAVPRTSPTCRAQLGGPGCNLNPARFAHEARIATADAETGAVLLADGPEPALLAGGSLRWVDGPLAGAMMQIVTTEEDGRLVLDRDLDASIAAGTRVIGREGCDGTIATCQARFGNAVNFRGEPFLPGNDLLTRYPQAGS